jgi:hypothetical protein
MEYKKAVAVLVQMLDKRDLDAEEKEAVLTAIGVLDWASLGKSRMQSLIKARKAKREKDIK